MSALGNRIRQLRKERKLTLADVAAGKLTKGMLSLIENGKAQPSMESLQHIASQLSVDLAQLVGNENIEEIRDLLEEVEGIWKTVTILDMKQAIEVCSLIKPFLTKLPDTYEGARVLQIYSEALYVQEKGQSMIEPFVERAETIYKKIHLYNEYVNTRIFRTSMQFRMHHYSGALQGCLELRDEIKKNGWRITEITRLQLFYYEAILYFAVGDYHLGMAKTEEALAFIKETKIYYLVEELYRLAHFVDMLGERKGFYLNKLKQYADFTESAYANWFCDYWPIHYYTSYTHDYGKAMAIIDEFNFTAYGFNELEKHIAETSILSEKGMALYGLKQYGQALDTLEMLEVPSYLHHPFDLSLEYQLYAYRALCHFQLGNRKEAEREIKEAAELIAPMPPTPYKDFILAAYEKIMGTV